MVRIKLNLFSTMTTERYCLREPLKSAELRRPWSLLVICDAMFWEKNWVLIKKQNWQICRKSINLICNIYFFNLCDPCISGMNMMNNNYTHYTKFLSVCVTFCSSDDIYVRSIPGGRSTPHGADHQCVGQPLTRMSRWRSSWNLPHLAGCAAVRRLGSQPNVRMT